MDLYLLILINTLVALWIIGVYYFFLSPLHKLKKALKKNNITGSINLLKQQLYAKFNKQSLLFQASNMIAFNKIKLELPISTNINISLSSTHKEGMDFYLYSNGNIFIPTKTVERYHTAFKNRNKYIELFNKYNPIFEKNRIISISLNKNKAKIALATKKHSYFANNLEEIVAFTKELSEIINSHNITEQQELYTNRKSSIQIYKKIIILAALTILMFTFIGVTVSFVEDTKISPKQIQKKQLFVQVWEIHKDYANVYDITQTKKDAVKNISSKTKVSLKEYQGFKPELVPWGFRVLPKTNYITHYKVLIFPKGTEMLGSLNFAPVKTIETDKYFILVYDLTQVKEASFIKIYMRYQGSLKDFDTSYIKESGTLWKVIL